MKQLIAFHGSQEAKTLLELLSQAPIVTKETQANGQLS
jgi:hypothetical protein